MKSSGWGLEKSGLTWEQNFYRPLELLGYSYKFQWSALQIGQDSFIYMLDIEQYSVECVTSSFISFAALILHIFQTYISPELQVIQIFAYGKQLFHSFTAFYVMHLKNQGVKI